MVWFTYTLYAITTSALLLLTIIFFYLQSTYSIWRKNNVPYIPAKFPWGNLKNPLKTKQSLGFVFKEIYDQFKQMGAKYGGLHIFTSPALMLLDPDYIKQILVQDFSNFHARGFYNNEKHEPMSANLVTLDGPKWKFLRGKYTSAFTTAKIKTMFSTVLNCAESMTTSILEDLSITTTVNINNLSARYTSSIVGSCAFGIDHNAVHQNVKFMENIEKCIDDCTRVFKLAFLSTFPNFSRSLRLKLFQVETLDYFKSLIQSSLKYRDDHSVRRLDFLQILKDMKEKDNIEITLEEIQAQCFLFFFAGYDTSSKTLIYILFELAKNAEIQDKLRIEINNVVQQDECISHQSINAMKYLQNVIDETLRKYPIIQVLNRKCDKDYRLPNSNIILEKGTAVLVPIMGIHHDPEIYPNPDVFDPDRFLAENKESRHPYVYLPFGEGPRSCLGSQFGYLILKVGLAELLRKFKFSLNQKMGTTLTFTENFLLTPAQDILLDVEIIP